MFVSGIFCNMQFVCVYNRRYISNQTGTEMSLIYSCFQKSCVSRYVQESNSNGNSSNENVIRNTTDSKIDSIFLQFQ
jgi:hypothetical protein